MVKKTILVVDDDLLMIKVISFTLSKNGFEVLEAANGQEALKVLDKNKQNISLIITDYNMPKLNGLELAKSVRTHQVHQNTPLILITSNPQIASELSKHSNVFNEIIHKPFSSELMVDKVTALLNK